MHTKQTQALQNADASTRPEDFPCFNCEAGQPTAFSNYNPTASLLEALWRTPDCTHQLGTIDFRTRRFKNIPVKSVSDAVDRVRELAGTRNEIYFAPAEYHSPTSREAANVSGAAGFWLDIDCGEGKAAAGKGYVTTREAQAALADFCRYAGLPEPTHIVSSGGGLHVYWVLDSFLDRETWQRAAAKLKRLSKAHGFLADDSRTADIASVLRLPGTLNYKYEPPRPVTMQFASSAHIAQAVMLESIDVAHERLCNVPPTRPALCRESDTTRTSIGDPDATNYGPPDIERLTSALIWLTPDCGDVAWKLRRVAPLANAAREYPDFADALYHLARLWSSGELTGIASIAWCNPGNNGFTGEEVFDEVWNRFLTTIYAGKPVTLGTIFFDAKEAGWDGCVERFDVAPYEVEGDA